MAFTLQYIAPSSHSKGNTSVAFAIVHARPDLDYLVYFSDTDDPSDIYNRSDIFNVYQRQSTTP